MRSRTCATRPDSVKECTAYGSRAYSALASLRTGISGSAFFHRVRRSLYALFAFTVSPDSASARASCSRAIASIGSTMTMLR